MNTLSRGLADGATKNFAPSGKATSLELILILRFGVFKPL
jgi:hypothetical protein